MKNFAIIIIWRQKKKAGAVLTKVTGYEKLLDITSETLGAAIKAAIYIVVVSLYLFDCFRTVVEKTKLIRFSIDDPWAQLEVCTSCSSIG